MTVPPPASARPPAPDRWAAGVVIVAAIFWLVDLGLLRTGTPHPLDDTWEYALAARAVIEGHGFRTPMIHPPLWELRDAAGTVPVLIHGPLVPALLAPIAALAGDATPEVAAWLAAAFAVLAAWLTYRLGAARFGPPVGAAAAGLFTFSPLTMTAVHHDHALVVGAALLAGALVLHLGERPRPFAAGVALGLAYLARPEMLLAGPAFALTARGAALRLLAGFTVAALPWWAHQLVATGQPFFNLSSYLVVGYWARPELSPLRDFALPPARWPEVLMETLPHLPGKWVALFPSVMKRALLAPTGATGWLALAGAALALAAERHRRAAALGVALAAIPVLVQTVTIYDSRYLVPFLPIWCVAAAWAAERIAARASWLRRPRAWMALLALVVLPSAAPAVRGEMEQARALRARLAAERQGLAALMARTGAAPRRPWFSDTPDFTAWTTGRTVLWVTREEFGRLPAPGEPNPRGLPERDSSRTWFHEDLSRAPRSSVD